MSDENNSQPAADSSSESRPVSGCRGCVWVAVGGFFVLISSYLFLPVISAYRGPAKRAYCGNNLHNIGTAMHSYAAKYGSFPPAYTVDRQGRRMHSWRVLLLEFLDHDLHAKYDFSRPWNSPENLAIAGMMRSNGLYRCPGEETKNVSWTSYVMLVGPRAFSVGSKGRKMEEITDGLENTAMVVEMSPSKIPWTSPYDLDTTEMSIKINDPDRVSPRSCHAGGSNVLFADGHGQFIGSDKSPENEAFLKAITTIDGGEDMSKFRD
jgi:prepilin-type processing-associated H-X9-DG protein